MLVSETTSRTGYAITVFSHISHNAVLIFATTKTISISVRTWQRVTFLARLTTTTYIHSTYIRTLVRQLEIISPRKLLYRLHRS